MMTIGVALGWITGFGVLALLRLIEIVRKAAEKRRVELFAISNRERALARKEVLLTNREALLMKRQQRFTRSRADYGEDVSHDPGVSP